MKKIAIVLALVCMFVSPALFAQTAENTTEAPNASTRSAKMVQHRVSYLTTVLSLTTAQQAQVTTILTNAAASHSNASTSMKTAHTNLQNAIHSNDAAAMEQAANSLGAISAQKALAHAKIEAAIYQTLTPEQQAKMTQLETQGGHRGKHGF
ncbi:MAG TPA: Spy/CpxP family protein refolding chaperone [Candidatus Acidoferrales bacterium]|nr:Spy/CpxP family protein refolding chaperone [Candidatus Acidoferrales bacterium]